MPVRFTTAGDGNLARYRVRERLVGKDLDNDAVGETPKVTGTIALDAAGRHALVVGNNGTIEAAREVGRGRLFATMDYCGFRMGALAAMAALRHLSGLPVPREIILPVEVVHRGNHLPWLVPIEQRPLPDWDALARA